MNYATSHKVRDSRANRGHEKTTKRCHVFGILSTFARFFPKPIFESPSSNLVMPIIRNTSSLNHCIKLVSTAPACCKRFLSESTHHDIHHREQVRVRFAPSPTGHIHLGGLRAALYNYIFARQHNGKFVLRIEDTDQARIMPGSADEIETVLQWAGIGPDESPRLGGPYGPYEQSKRLHLYREHAERLLAEGKAYRCFCSPNRLELLRKFQARNRERTRYDGKCKHLTASEIEEKLAETNNRYVIRFSLVGGQQSYDDLVFGTISANLVEAQESDPVILKSDGYPTYHFANVVDDHQMAISHVLRGSEWIASTIKHIQLYQAFRWQPPGYLHLPLITMHDGAKMSKRNDQDRVRSWIEAGYQPETLFNFLTNSGGGVPKWKQDGNEFWTLDQLVSGFEFKKLTTHGGSLDLNRLRVYSATELQRAWLHDKSAVMERYRALLKRKGVVADIEDELAEKAVGRLIGRLTSIDDLLAHEHAFIWRQPELNWSMDEYKAVNWPLDKLVEAVIELVERVENENAEELVRRLKELAACHGVDYAKFMRFLRKLLTNSEKGLPVSEIFACLGSSRSINYLKNGLDYVRS